MGKACGRLGMRLFVTMAMLPAGVLAAATPARAQDAAPAPTDARDIDFNADTLSYDQASDTVTASGNVAMTSEGNRVRADRIVWTRRSGEVRAIGNVVVVNPGGDIVYGDNVALTDTLRDGAVDNMLLVLADGGRLAAVRGSRANGVTTLDDAAYSPCPVVSDTGCPRRPTWQINAARVIHDPARNRLRFERARLRLFGITFPVVPVLTQTLGEQGKSGLLQFDLQYTSTNGLELAVPYYIDLSPQRDLTVTTHIFTNVLPMLEGTYRAITRRGAYRVTAFGTYSSRIPVTVSAANARKDFRGYVEAVGKFQLGAEWSLAGSIRRTSDRTFLRRYDLPYDDRLRSTVAIEQLGARNYFYAGLWATQTLRPLEDQGQQPIAAPVIDYRRRWDTPLDGKLETQLNLIALTRTSGQDTQRAFAAARWDRRSLTALGQELILTGYARADVYHSDENLRTATASYRGRPGFQARAIGAVAAEIRWPFIGALFGGTQRLTPRLQFVASPQTANLRVPNEDARAVDLEDSNLFALNRFPGYDRWEDGPRVTYGVDWQLDRPGLSLSANVGQSYRFTTRPTILPPGTGLNDRTSDVVGRETNRYRLDKSTLAVRRNEIDATVGSDSTYATIGYLKLNRNVDIAIEDLRDREEARLGGRVQVTRYISLFGSATIDLTSRAEDPASLSDGYQPVRHRLGIAYTDDCLDLGLTWRRDYDTSGDARAGNSFLLRLAFRGFGR